MSMHSLPIKIKMSSWLDCLQVKLGSMFASRTYLET